MPKPRSCPHLRLSGEAIRWPPPTTPGTASSRRAGENERFAGELAARDAHDRARGELAAAGGAVAQRGAASSPR
ncbi:MAG: hypothetical protein L0K86_21015, partial [Actinomycetia bacterium]|nr:hypothetical protein [Actinomycetes bacterium]